MALDSDGLLDHLLFKVAITGQQGLDVQGLSDAVTQFYTRIPVDNEEQNINVEDDILFSLKPPGSSDGNSSRASDPQHLEKLWTWLVDQPDVEATNKDQATDSNTSFQEESTNESNPLAAVFRAHANERLVATENRVWQALTDHGVDYRRIPKLEFQCLSIIAAAGPGGLLQPDVTRITGQDKRSVPKRTDALAQKGLITKEHCVGLGIKTSVLIFKKFVQQGESQTLFEVGGNAGHTPKNGLRRMIRYDEWFSEIIGHLEKNNNVMALVDLRKEMGISGKRWETRSLHRCLRRLGRSGLIFKAKLRTAPVDYDQEQADLDADSDLDAEIDADADAEVDAGYDYMEDLSPKKAPKRRNRKNTRVRWTRVVKLLRDPTEKDKEAFISHAAAERVYNNGEDLEDIEADDDEEIEVDHATLAVAGPSSSKVQTKQRIPPQWHPGIHHTQLIFNLIHSRGTTGISTMDLTDRAMGHLWRRPLDELLGRLTDVWQVSQPVHLRHLSVVRDTAFLARASHYQFRSFENFKKLVHAGQVTWDAIQIKSSEIENEAADLDAWGFPCAKPAAMTGPDGSANMTNCKLTVIKPSHRRGWDISQARGRTLTAAQIATPRPRGRPRKLQPLASPSVASQAQSTPSHPQPKRPGDELSTTNALSRAPSGIMTPESRAQREVLSKTKRKLVDTSATGSKKSTAKILFQMNPKRVEAEMKEWKARVKRLAASLVRAEMRAQAQRDPTSSDQPDQFSTTNGDDIDKTGGALLIPGERLAEIENDIMTRSKPGAYINPPGSGQLKMFITMPTGRPSRYMIAVIKSQQLERFAWFNQDPNPKPLPRKVRINARLPAVDGQLSDASMETETPQPRETSHENVDSAEPSMSDVTVPVQSQHQHPKPDFIIKGGRKRKSRVSLMEHVIKRQAAMSTLGEPTYIPSSLNDDGPTTESSRDLTGEEQRRPYPPPETLAYAIDTAETTAKHQPIVDDTAMEYYTPESPSQATDSPLVISKPPTTDGTPDHPQTKPHDEQNIALTNNIMLDINSEHPSSHEATAEGEQQSFNHSTAEAVSGKMAIDGPQFREQSQTREPDVTTETAEEVSSSVPLDGDGDHEGVDARPSKSSEAFTVLSFEQVWEDAVIQPQSSRHKVGVPRSGGVTKHQRAEVVLGIIRKNGGVFGGDRELHLPFIAEWEKNHPQRPDRHTLTRVVAGLVLEKKIKKFAFTFEAGNGTIAKKNVLVVPELDPESGIVKELLQNMILAYPDVYIPGEYTVADYSQMHVRNEINPEQSKRGQQLTVRDHFPEDASGFISRLYPKPRTHNVKLGMTEAKLERDMVIRKRKREQEERRQERYLRAQQEEEIEDATNALQTHFQLDGYRHEPDLAKVDRGLHGRSRLSKLQRWGASDRTAQKKVLGLLDATTEQELADQAEADLLEDDRSRPKSPKKPKRPPAVSGRARFAPSGVLNTTSPSSGLSGFGSTLIEVFTITTPYQRFYAGSGTFSTDPLVIAAASKAVWIGTTSHPGPPGEQLSMPLADIFRQADSNDPRFPVINTSQHYIQGNSRLPLINNPLGNVLVDPPRRHSTWTTQNGFSVAPSLRMVDPLYAASQGRQPRPGVKPTRVTVPRASRSGIFVMTEAEEKRLILAVAIVRSLLGGLQGASNWGFIHQIFHYKFEANYCRNRWSVLRSRHAGTVDKLQAEFQEIFIEAYERGEVQAIDYMEPEKYDWVRLVDWAEDCLDPSRIESLADELPDLVPDRKILENSFEIKIPEELYGIGKEDYWTPLVTHLRREELANTWTHSAIVRAENKKNSQDPLMLAKSWVRANVLTPDNEFNNTVAHEKLAQLGQDVLHKALDELLGKRIIRMENKGRAIPGRNYDISDTVLTAFKRTWDVTHLRLAASFKATVDAAFSSDGKLEISYNTPDYNILAMTNLIGGGRAKVVPHFPPVNNDFDAPWPRLTKWGMTEGDYKTVQMDRTRLHFGLELQPTDNYLHGDPLQRVDPPLSLQVDGEIRPRLPMWTDINGKLIQSVWDMMLMATLHHLVFRPGLTAEAMALCYKGKLWAWEIDLFLHWAEEAKLARKVGEGEEDGWSAAEWWWLAFAER